MTARTVPPWTFYVAAYILVLVYLNTFDLWVLLRTWGGEAAAHLPIALSVVVAAAILGVGARRARARGGILWWPIAAAAALAAIGLAMTDPLFPSKRIHVPQYILLALVVRAGLSRQLSGWRLTFMGALIATLFGCHDELLQGLHPKRTYGWPDMQVNALGALSGSLLAYGLRLLDRGRASDSVPRVLWLGVGAALLGFILFLDALQVFRTLSPPVWIALPALGGLLALSLADARAACAGGLRHALALAAVLIGTALLYPYATHVAPLVFE
jgi:hypothetical protein